MELVLDVGPVHIAAGEGKVGLYRFTGVVGIKRDDAE
jgi:hypothetical protein